MTMEYQSSCRENEYFTLEDIDRARQIAKKKTPEDEGRLYAIFYEIVLDELKNQSLILSYRETKHQSSDDQNGVDFWITTITGKEIPIGITGSRMDNNRRKRKHTNIPTIQILINNYKPHNKKTKTVGVLMDKTLSIILQYEEAIDF